MLCTGASHTGKTLLAQRLLARRGWPYLSLDHLKMGLIRSGQTPLTPQSGEAALTALLWPIAREMARVCAENGQNLVIEGCYMPLDFRRDLDAATRAQTRGVCLSLSPDYIRAHFAAVLSHGGDIERRSQDDLTAERCARENAAFAAYDAAHGWLRLDVRRDYEQEMRAFLEELDRWTTL